jgi:hypothetical protein
MILNEVFVIGSSEIAPKFEDLSASGGLKPESDTVGIEFTFHRASAEISENSHFWMNTIQPPHL